MNGIGGTVKNAVFRQIEVGKFTIHISTEFSKAASKDIPSIKSLSAKQLYIGGAKQY